MVLALSFPYFFLLLRFFATITAAGTPIDAPIPEPIPIPNAFSFALAFLIYLSALAF
jgi:hypothetical protein